MTTREKIIQTSKTYFNQHGFGAPSLYVLSQEMGISRGNVTYYFKDKETLLDALVQEMWQEYQAGQIKATQFPSWNIIKKSMKVLHELQQSYSFIFFDKQIFFHPAVKTILQKIESDSIKTQMSMFSFSIQLGNMKKEPAPGIYHNICKAIWMTAFYWQISAVYKQDDADSWDTVMWSLLYPHFTKKGRKGFINRFGEAYVQSLGIPLEVFEKEQIEF